jgi:hypothetical protein
MTSCPPAVGYPQGNPELDAFLELLCADDDLIRTEFEAIVAAGWPTPPTAGPSSRQHVGADGGPAPHRRRTHTSTSTVDRHPGIDAWARQRSPPGR